MDRAMPTEDARCKTRSVHEGGSCRVYGMEYENTCPSIFQRPRRHTPHTRRYFCIRLVSSKAECVLDSMSASSSGTLMARHARCHVFSSSGVPGGTCGT